MVVRHLVTVQAERSATTYVRVIANSTLRDSLQSSDFEHPVTASRRAALDKIFRARVLDQGVLLAELYDKSGRVTYSTDHRRVGRNSTAETGHLSEALNGTVRGDATKLSNAGAQSRKALRTYAPVAMTGRCWSRRPVRAEEAEDLAFLDVEADPAQSLGGPVGLPQVADGDRTHSAGSVRSA